MCWSLGGPGQRGCTKSLCKARTGFPTWQPDTTAGSGGGLGLSNACSCNITFPILRSMDNQHPCIFLPAPGTTDLQPKASCCGSPRHGARGGAHAFEGPGTTYLLCFPFNRANYPCNCPPKREKGVQDPWQLLFV